MELCYNRRKDIWAIRINIIVFCLVALITTLAAVLVWRDSIHLSQKWNGIWGTELFLLSLTIVAIIWNICFCHLYFRKYSVNSRGINVKILKNVKHYSWDMVSEISVCDVNLATKGPGYDMVIRIVIGNEKNGPSNPNCTRSVINGIEHWRDQSYEIKHLKQVISVIYSDDRLQEIKLLSGKEIKDYRTRRGKEQKINIG